MWEIQSLEFLQRGERPPDEGDSAYVQARQRLPRERLEKALSLTARPADRRAGAGGELRGHPVKVADASTTQLADTQQNQKVYPKPSTQKCGCGFPMMKFVVLFSLCSGAVLNGHAGQSAQSRPAPIAGFMGAAQQRRHPLDLCAAVGEYSTLAGLARQGVDVVARLHQAVKSTFASPAAFSAVKLWLLLTPGAFGY